MIQTDKPEDRELRIFRNGMIVFLTIIVLAVLLSAYIYGVMP